MKTKRIIAMLLAQVTIGFILSAVVFAQPSLSPTAAEIDQSVSAALRDLYAHNGGAKVLGAKAKAVLVFPDIKKGAFIVGAQWGYGALRKGARSIGYYRTAAASYGLQAGVKKFGYALF